MTISGPSLVSAGGVLVGRVDFFAIREGAGRTVGDEDRKSLVSFGSWPGASVDSSGSDAPLNGVFGIVDFLTGCEPVVCAT